MTDGSLAIWHGIQRSSIDWHPTVDPSRCNGCGMCVVTCGEKRNVYGYDRSHRKAVVLAPENCMVGCINCMVGCLWGAITFPDERTVKELVRSLPTERLAEELRVKIDKNPALALRPPVAQNSGKSVA